MLIAMDGVYQTTDGRPARILCVDGERGTGPVVAIIPLIGSSTKHGIWSFMPDGRQNPEHPSAADLIESITAEEVVLRAMSGETFEIQPDPKNGLSKFAVIAVEALRVTGRLKEGE